jgi:CheY-like chemotaxis protein
MLEVDKTVEAMIRKGTGSRDLEVVAASHGYRTLADACLYAVREGMSTLEEVGPYLLEQREEEAILQTLSDSPVAEQAPMMMQPVQMPQQPVHQAPQPVLGEAGKDRILLVEDDDDIRTVLAMMLEEELYEVEEACDGVEGLEAVMKCPPSIVLCDLMMSRMDGKRFPKRLKSKANTKHIPVIILTANASEENELDLLDLGADDYISKTTSQKVLLTRIRRTLARH